MYKWVVGCIYGWKSRWEGGWIGRCLDPWVSGWWMNGCMDMGVTIWVSG